MFGIGLIIIGVVILLQVAGLLPASGIVWGIVLILIGVMMVIRRSIRRNRRRQWMMEHREKKS